MSMMIRGWSTWKGNWRKEVRGYRSEPLSGKGHADYKKRALSPLFIQVFYPLNTLVQTHCDCAQDDDGGDYHVELEHL